MSTAVPLHALRREELARRIKALPDEVAAWKARVADQPDMNSHYSQVQALEILVDALVKKQRKLLEDLDPAGDAEVFRVVALELVEEIIKGQRVWNFFRSKLDLRFSPDFKDLLWVADTIAWDCYQPIMNRAVDATIVPAAQVREPPLTYLTAEFSPATWVRGSRPNDGHDYHLGSARLPIPVIEIPWDHIGNLWELVSLQHEVGHDLEADLNLRPQLLASLQSALLDADVPTARTKTWLSWAGEIFADLIGLRLGGPAFLLGLMHLILLPAHMVTKFDPTDPHPTHYLRILLNTEYLRRLIPDSQILEPEAAAIEDTWKSQYGDLPSFKPLLQDAPHVFRALMEDPLTGLKGKAVRDLVPFSELEYTKIQAAAYFLRTGMSAPARQSMTPRHCVSAARLAATEVYDTVGNGTSLDQFDAPLEEINNRLIQMVRDNALPGLRAAEMPSEHIRFIAGFADLL